MSLKKITIIFLLFLSGCGSKIDSLETSHYDILKTEPIQEELDEDKTFSITSDIEANATHTYKIGARVLGVEEYSFGAVSDAAPLDLALGWGTMADKEKLEKSKISISQGSRFYHWQVPNFDVYSRKEISYQSANVHIVPENDEIREYLSNKVNEGDLIYMEGYLVNLEAEAWTQKTSIKREDTGAGACEILYVTSVVHLIEE